MGPVSANVSSPSFNSGNILSKNLDQIGSRSDSEVKSRAKTDQTQPQGVELARSQSSSRSNERSATQRGSLLDISA